jgi:hypothetical protein
MAEIFVVEPVQCLIGDNAYDSDRLDRELAETGMEMILLTVATESSILKMFFPQKVSLYYANVNNQRLAQPAAHAQDGGGPTYTTRCPQPTKAGSSLPPIGLSESFRNPQLGTAAAAVIG